MKLEDAREIQADPATVWSAILDPEILKTCIPGCEELTGNVEDGFDAIVVQKVGPVKAKFNGRVTVSDIEEGERLTLSGHGKGGPAGFASGEAVVRLEQIDAESTRLHYAVDAKVGGKLAQLGSRIIDGFAKKLADQFFERLQTGLESPDGSEPEQESAKDEPKKGWIARLRG